MREPAPSSLTIPRAAALYIGALVGPGLLLLPGVAVADAGPASIVAWISLLGLSGLLAAMFAVFGTRFPSSTGPADYIEAGLGATIGRSARWVYIAGVLTGAPLVSVIAASYVSEAVRLSSSGKTIVAIAILAVGVGISQLGLRGSTGVQLGLIAALIVTVAAAVTTTVPADRARNWSPFAPHGWIGVGSAAAALMMSFVGWEAASPLVHRLRSPRNDVRRVIAIAFTATSLLYLTLAVELVSALGSAANTSVPVGRLLRVGFGVAGPLVAAVAALMLTLGVINAYVTGAGEFVHRLFAGGRFEPRRVLGLATMAIGIVVIVLFGMGVMTISTAVTIPTAMYVSVYLGCALSAIRLFGDAGRTLGVTIAIAVLVILIFLAWASLAAVLLIAIVVLTDRFRVRKGAIRAA